MKIYTKTGDQGETGLFAGPRVSKNDPRLAAYGSVDELNAVLGMVLCSINDARLSSQLVAIQSDLFSVGAELATPDPDAQGMRLLDQSRVGDLEKSIDQMEDELPPLKHFILPGGSPGSAALHWARTVCRRAERDVVTLSQQPNVADYSQVVIFLNRLSDWLFVAARHQNVLAGVPDQPWLRPSASDRDRKGDVANS
jgi:cob(I)alamin adenosyltransferase